MGRERLVGTPFEGAIDATQFVLRTREVLAPHGFDRTNTIGCAGLCRDELTHGFAVTIGEHWGQAFNLSSLGGAPTCGRTGLTAALHHAPRVGPRRQYVFFVMPHIGLGHDGEWGVCRRPGIAQESRACGALTAVREQWSDGPPTLDECDIEFTLLARQLHERAGAGCVPDLPDLTRLTSEMVIERLEGRLAETLDHETMDYAVFPGVQIHTSRSDLVWPGPAYLVRHSERISLQI